MTGRGVSMITRLRLPRSSATARARRGPRACGIPWFVAILAGAVATGACGADSALPTANGAGPAEPVTETTARSDQREPAVRANRLSSGVPDRSFPGPSDGSPAGAAGPRPESAALDLPIAATARRPRVGSPPSATKSSRTTLNANKMAPLVIKVGSSLCLVLGIFLGLLWLQKRFPAATPKSVPPEVIEVLGTFSLATRHDTCVLRFGNKVLAVRVQGGKAEKLAEIDEPSEVQRITNCCRHPAHDSGDTLREPTLELLAHQLASQRRSR